MTDGLDWFARYKFCQPLGQGGMGTLYLAEDRTHDNVRCVIKQLNNKYSDPTEQSEAIRLFQREALILRNLNHVGIVRVFDDHVTEDGRYFLVMDYVPGKNLEAILNQSGPFTSETTIQIAIQCCEILEYLHGLNPPVIYRDLKPSNLMLTPDGRIIFIDFGIARSFIPKESATRVVTAGYSPPEQYFGKPETRSDLYALGATLSHLLTGKRPKPLNPCTPRLLNAQVLESLDGLCRQLTAHNADERPPTAAAVRYELYKSYKEIHPEFEIPWKLKTDVDVQKPEAPQAEAEGQSLAPALLRMRAGLYTSSGQNSVKNNEEPASASAISNKHRLAVSGRPSLWQRLKQWLHI